MQAIRSDKLRQSARGQQCTLQISGVCNHDPETTVLAHLPDESKGMGRKADDICACFACSACHDVLDGRINHWPITEADREFYMRRALIRTWRKWVEMGLIHV